MATEFAGLHAGEPVELSTEARPSRSPAVAVTVRSASTLMRDGAVAATEDEHADVQPVERCEHRGKALRVDSVKCFDHDDEGRDRVLGMSLTVGGDVGLAGLEEAATARDDFRFDAAQQGIGPVGEAERRGHGQTREEGGARRGCRAAASKRPRPAWTRAAEHQALTTSWAPGPSTEMPDGVMRSRKTGSPCRVPISMRPGCIDVGAGAASWSAPFPIISRVGFGIAVVGASGRQRLEGVGQRRRCRASG